MTERLMDPTFCASIRYGTRQQRQTPLKSNRPAGGGKKIKPSFPSPIIPGLKRTVRELATSGPRLKHSGASLVAITPVRRIDPETRLGNYNNQAELELPFIHHNSATVRVIPSESDMYEQTTSRSERIGQQQRDDLDGQADDLVDLQENEFLATQGGNLWQTHEEFNDWLEPRLIEVRRLMAVFEDLTPECYTGRTDSSGRSTAQCSH